MVCRLFGDKPLFEPMLIYCLLDPCKQRNMNQNITIFFYENEFKCVACKISLNFSWCQFVNLSIAGPARILEPHLAHYNDVIHVMAAMASQITSLTIVYSTGCRSKQTSKLRATGHCVGNSPEPVNSPHKWPVRRKMFPFDDVIMVVVSANVLTPIDAERLVDTVVTSASDIMFVKVYVAHNGFERIWVSRSCSF